MLRDKSLVPLSRQHQHALALCVRIAREAPAAGVDVERWQSEIAQHFQQEIRIHFAAEEQVLFPAARKFEELASLVEELLAEHQRLREDFAMAQTRALQTESLLAFGKRLSSHIRKEERRLFERMQQLMTAQELAALAAPLENALKDAGQACALPVHNKST